MNRLAHVLPTRILSLVVLSLLPVAVGAQPPVSVAHLGPTSGDAGSPAGKELGEESPVAEKKSNRVEVLLASLTIFVLAIFVGFEVITKVPPTLHTPLMSGSNAISGIALVGAAVVAGKTIGFSSFLGMVAVMLATINVVGGFMVTHRMLAMFKKKKR